MNIEQLNEAKNENKNGVLASYKATFMQFNKVNENNRIYPSEIGKNRILTEKVQQAMKENKLLGEINHPKDRFDVDYEKVAINTTSLYYDESSDSIKGTFDILDTPMGRILKTLVDYGTHISLSARAMGKSRNVKGVDEILEDTYVFKTFDAVTDPGFSIATIDPSKDKINESLKDLYESFNDDEKIQVNPLLESIGMPVDFLYNDTSSQDNATVDNNDNEPLSEDKSDIQNLISEYESIIAILKSQVEANDENMKVMQLEFELVNQIQSSNNEEKVNELESKIDEYKSAIDTLTNSLKASDDKINELSSKLNESECEYAKLKTILNETLKSMKNKKDLLIEENQSYQKDIQDYSSSLVESNNKYEALLKDYKELQEKYDVLLNDYQESTKKDTFELTESSISEGTDDITLVNVILESNNKERPVDLMTNNLLNKLNKK